MMFKFIWKVFYDCVSDVRNTCTCRQQHPFVLLRNAMSHFLTDVDKIEWKLCTTEWKVVTRGIGFHLLGLYYSPRFARGCKADPRGVKTALGNTFPWAGINFLGEIHLRWRKVTLFTSSHFSCFKLTRKLVCLLLRYKVVLSVFPFDEKIGFW